MAGESATVAAAGASAPAAGGGGAAADAPSGSPVERMRAFLSAPAASAEPAQEQTEAASADVESAGSALPEDKQVPEAAQAAEDQAEDSGDEQSGDEPDAEWHPSKLTDLAEAIGYDEDKFLALPVSVKVDGKEGTATLRDLIRSYQLDSHISQKAESVNTDRKAFEAERQRFQTERADKLLKLDASLKTAERLLAGEFAQVDWQRLASEDPAAYNAKFVDFQRRQAELDGVAQQINAEREQFQAQQAEQQKAWLDEQRKLLHAKVPEWSDDTRRAKETAEIADMLEKEFGITKAEFEAVVDHRYAMLIRAAWQWQKLQKQKPAVLAKVKAAPKLLKPGTQQSRAVVDKLASDRERNRLRQTGRVADAVPALKRALFGAR